MFHERVVMSKNFKFKKTYVWHLQTLSINQRVIANIEIDPPRFWLISPVPVSWFMHHALSFLQDQHPRLVNSWPISMITIVSYGGARTHVERSTRNDRSRKLHLLYLLSFRKWNRANGTWYRLRLCRINYLSLSSGIDDTIVSDASNARHLLEDFRPVL